MSPLPDESSATASPGPVAVAPAGTAPAAGGRPLAAEPEASAPAAKAGARAAVITCSDSAADGVAVDTSGPLAAALLSGLGHEVTRVTVVPDEVGAIVTAVRAAIAAGARIVVTTGGTGAGPRDVTPEALRSAGLRELPGLGEAIRAASRERMPTADLSRSLGGILDGAAVLALPGSNGGVRDGLGTVGSLLEHAAQVAGGAGHVDRRGTGAEPAAVVVDSVDPRDRIDYHNTGVDAVALVRDSPISEAEVAEEVSRAAAGAVVTFAGVVRDHDRGRAVTALHYEGHPDAGRILAEVLAEALDRPGVLAAAARHRVATSRSATSPSSPRSAPRIAARRSRRAAGWSTRRRHGCPSGSTSASLTGQTSG